LNKSHPFECGTAEYPVAFCQIHWSVLKLRNMFKLVRCCGCTTLRTGTLIIGTLNLIGCVLGVVAASVVVGLLISAHDEIWATLTNFTMNSTCQGAWCDIQHQQQYDLVKTWTNVTKICLWIGIAFLSFHTLVNIGLLVGVTQRIPCLVTTWVVIEALGLCLSTLSAIASFVRSSNGGAGQFFVSAITSLAGVGLGFYFLLVVINFRRELIFELRNPNQLPGVAYNIKQYT